MRGRRRRHGRRRRCVRGCRGQRRCRGRCVRGRWWRRGRRGGRVCRRWERRGCVRRRHIDRRSRSQRSRRVRIDLRRVIPASRERNQRSHRHHNAAYHTKHESSPTTRDGTLRYSTKCSTPRLPPDCAPRSVRPRPTTTGTNRSRPGLNPAWRNATTTTACEARTRRYRAPESALWRRHAPVCPSRRA